MDSRELLLKQWLAKQPLLSAAVEAQGFDEIYSLNLLCGDASMRRYFRCCLKSDANGRSWIVADTPVDCSNFVGFTAIAKQWARLNIPVPELIAEDNVDGFMLLEDLGDETLLAVLTAENADHFYRLAMDHLITIQNSSTLSEYELPSYDLAMLNREMGLFTEWLVTELLGLSLSDEDQQMLQTTFATLAQSALQQPLVTVHRDYHSRNLMVIDDAKLAIIDFQDAVKGPVSYDIVSLLKDCYIRWPKQQRQNWLHYYLDAAEQAAVFNPSQRADMLKWFDFMGAQRHLKAAGIFARLKVRDGKPGYLADIPRTLGYIVELTDYPELAPFINWAETMLIPAMKKSACFDNESIDKMLCEDIRFS